MDGLNTYRGAANFIYEAGILSKTPRSGFHFLGSGEQSVAEHLNRTAYVGFVLASLDGKADVGRVVQMCLFHDFVEARTSDLNYVHQKYVHSDEISALSDLTKNVFFGQKIEELMREYTERTSMESLLAKDADQIEWIASLKEQADIGNERAKEWIPSAVLRLKTEAAKRLAEEILAIGSDAWWFKKDDAWFVHRDGAKGNRL